MSDRPKEKDRVRSSSDSGEHFGHSAEDDGANHQSTKKHKDCHSLVNPEVGSDAEHMPIDQPEVEPRSYVGNRNSSVSYKESLIGVILAAYESAFFGSSMEEDGGDVSEEEEDDDPPEDGEVVIKFPCELKQKIRAPWCTSLIVKVFGQSVGYVFLVNKLKNMLISSGNFSCVDLELRFFLLDLSQKKGLKMCLKEDLGSLENISFLLGRGFLTLELPKPLFLLSQCGLDYLSYPLNIITKTPCFGLEVG